MINRFVTNYKPAGTRSFRLASSQLFDFGGNAQNGGGELLECLTADEGKVIVQSDQSGAEALVVAYLAEEGNYRKLFKVNIKPHTYMAMHLFPERWPFTKPKDYYLSCPVEDLPNTPNWKAINKAIKESDNQSGRPYYIGKKTCHGKSYDMKWRTFQLSVLKDSGGELALTPKESKHFLGMFDQLFPEIIAWQDEVKSTVISTRKLVNLFGFPRQFNKLISDSYLREALSWIPQSTVGTITNNACIKMQDYIEENNLAWDLLSNKHDSLATQVPPEDVAKCTALQESFLAARLQGQDCEFIMKSETQVGFRWSKGGTDGMK